MLGAQNFLRYFILVFLIFGLALSASAQSDRGTRGHRCAQHVAGGELHDAVLCHETLRLRALPRPRGPEQNQPHSR